VTSHKKLDRKIPGSRMARKSFPKLFSEEFFEKGKEKKER
jgi:hypothetical protein